jgi:threonine dehydrogenase-like Zn-dependent dehydrogenase
MRALSLDDNQLRFSHDHPPPVTADDEILVKVIQAGICETDLQLARGYMGFSGVLGHEFVGVAQSGPLEGRRVVGEINCNCRSCPRCAAGLGNHCGQRTVIGIDRHDGAFADFVSVPQHNLHALPDAVSDDEAVFVEPLAAAFQISEQVNIGKHERVVICGDGRLALLSAKAILLSGADVAVIGKHANKLARFESLGVTTHLLSDSITDQSYDIVVDCTGSTSGLPLALELVRPRGTIVMKTTVAANHDLSLAKIVIDEITLVGSRCGPFAQAIAALASRDVDVSSLITHRYPIEAAVEAMNVAKSPDALKVVLEF